MHMAESQTGDILYLKRGGELILYLSGDVKASLAVSMYHRLVPHLEAGDVDHVHLDLSRVAYIDSTTIGTFIKARKMLSQADAELHLWNLSEQTTRILSTMHLLGYFDVGHTDALDELRTGVLDRIPEAEKEFITDDYVLTAHQDIVEAEPSLKETFEPLITALRQNVERKGADGADSS